MVLPSLFHEPVLVREVIDGLAVKSGQWYIDATIGGGGYTAALLEKGAHVIGIDRDHDAIAYVQHRFQNNPHAIFVQGNYKELASYIALHNIACVSGVAFDLGVSSYQLQQSKRGFSFQADEPLDMRMNVGDDITAEVVINTYAEEKLYEIFLYFAEEINARAIAHAIVRTRSIDRIQTTGQLRQIVETVLQKQQKHYMPKEVIKTLARIFQAIRIEVNTELENIRMGVTEALRIIEPTGRIAVVSFHSLEDRLIKRIFQEQEAQGYIKLVTKRPIQASWEEQKRNSKARSAKLRIAEKI